jgi:HEAT repeat protein
VITGGSLLVGLVAMAGVLAGLATITAVRKLGRGITERRARDADARMRPALIQLVADPDGAPSFPTPRGRDAHAVERLSTELLGKVRGEAHATLSTLLRERGVIERACDRLHGRGAVGRARAVELLGAARAADAVPEVVRLLAHDRNPAVRIVAARALGRIGDPVAVAPLLASLAGGVPAGTVAHSILQVGPPAEPALREQLTGGAEAGRAVAAELLGLLGSVASVADLTRTLTEDPEPRARALAATAIGRIGSPAGIGGLLGALGPDRTAAERAAAAEALGRMTATVAVDRLVPMVDEPLAPVARAAAGALAELGSEGRRELESLAGLGGVAAAHAGEALGAR